MKDSCPGCESKEIQIFYEVRNVPVHSVLLMASYSKAKDYPKGDIILGFCRNCGFIYNLAFDPTVHEYSSRYEETQAFSSTFNAFHKNLAKYLIEKYDLYNKTIIEIGCGKGEFLTILCEMGNNDGVGFDPSFINERVSNKSKNQITFIKDFYSEKYSNYQGDFLVCKMTLEHIHNVADFIRTVRRSLRNQPNITLFFQVPDVTRILNQIAFWDIYYEHCSYFSPGSLARLFRKCELDVVNLWRSFDDQYLMIEARPGNEKLSSPLPQEDSAESLSKSIKYFSENYENALKGWKQKIEKLKHDGGKIVLWGSGSKGVAFLTTLKINGEIEYAVDINPYRQGSYMTGAGQKIVAPEFLREYSPDKIIIMNPVYRDEIQQSLNSMGVKTELVTV